ncbi:hypothetical protein BDB00DRAFT_874984 [Zychaea mexicana]|uniref:uncharacterized protein n=1 Tax=Zychaea mexicana TaxID=64656 RepID=UPI0022FF02F0|nr:uncharacterized protein BDB00DRAFT_874984 [Zychaea mexicana]KAI9490814.1 hypothetical protein BDB00DRAFT_874984 [Zychaea mexicana]
MHDAEEEDSKTWSQIFVRSLTPELQMAVKVASAASAKDQPLNVAKATELLSTVYDGTTADLPRKQESRVDQCRRHPTSNHTNGQCFSSKPESFSQKRDKGKERAGTKVDEERCWFCGRIRVDGNEYKGKGLSPQPRSPPNSEPNQQNVLPVTDMDLDFNMVIDKANQAMRSGPYIQESSLYPVGLLHRSRVFKLHQRLLFNRTELFQLATVEEGLYVYPFETVAYLDRVSSRSQVSRSSSDNTFPYVMTRAVWPTERWADSSASL